MKANTEKGIRIGFACFELDDDLHLSIGRHYDASPEKLVEMQEFVDSVLKPLLPFHIRFGNYTMLGENFNIPVYPVEFIYEAQKKEIETFYRRFYNEAPGKRLYPNPFFHVTCDTPRKLEVLEVLIRASLTKPSLKLSNLVFKTRVEGGFCPIDVDAGTWQCPIDGIRNDNSMKVCKAEGCDQWRPKELFAAGNQPFKPGDWKCEVCTYVNFANRLNCGKCTRYRPGVSSMDSKGVYDLPPSAPPIAAVVDPIREQRNPPPYDPTVYQKGKDYGGKRQDWWCARCQFKVFGSKDACSKCGTRR